LYGDIGIALNAEFDSIGENKLLLCLWCHMDR